MTKALKTAKDLLTLSPASLLSFLPWLALLGWLSSVAWFLTDDAFISFRYTRNLLEGHGLVFNPGEYVEGYTNFLWILELAAIWGIFGLRPEHAAPWLSVALHQSALSPPCCGGSSACPRCATGALSAGWRWACSAAARPSPSGPRAADSRNAAIHLFHRHSGRLPQPVRETAVGDCCRVIEPGRGRTDATRRPDAGRLLLRLVRLSSTSSRAKGSAPNCVGT